MKKARLTINTQVDGAPETTTSVDAEMELGPLEASLRYEEQGAIVNLTVKNGDVFIERKGDYTFSLHLSEGKELPATLGIMGTVGDIKTKTQSIIYSLSEKSLLLSIKYSLLFSAGEKQEMKLRLIARI